MFYPPAYNPQLVSAFTQAVATLPPPGLSHAQGTLPGTPLLLFILGYSTVPSCSDPMPCASAGALGLPAMPALENLPVLSVVRC